MGCYLFNDDVAYFQGLAWHDCFIERSHLLVIDDKEEDEFVRAYLTRLFKYPTNQNATFWTAGVAANMTYSNWVSSKDAADTDAGPGIITQFRMALVGRHGFK